MISRPKQPIHTDDASTKNIPVIRLPTPTDSSATQCIPVINPHTMSSMPVMDVETNDTVEEKSYQSPTKPASAASVSSSYAGGLIGCKRLIVNQIKVHRDSKELLCVKASSDQGTDSCYVIVNLSCSWYDCTPYHLFGHSEYCSPFIQVQYGS
jgi:hypothetical protein